MRDLRGVERGSCAACAARNSECCEYAFSLYPEDDGSDDFPDAAEEDPEAYRRNPLLGCIARRLSAPAPEPPAASEPAACSSCGCAAEAHQAIDVTDAEERCLARARRVYAPFDLSLIIRQSVRDTLSLGLLREQFLYGEVGELSFLRLLDRVRTLRGPAAPGRFFDLGCGAGKAVVLAALHPIGFERCIGVELLPGLAHIARLIGERFEAHAGGAAQRPSPVAMLEADLFEADLTGASLVLLNAGSWAEPGLSRLRERLLRELPDRCLLATIRRPLALEGSAELVPLEEVSLPMSWGVAPVFLAERRRRLDLNAMD